MLPPLARGSPAIFVACGAPLRRRVSALDRKLTRIKACMLLQRDLAVRCNILHRAARPPSGFQSKRHLKVTCPPARPAQPPRLVAARHPAPISSAWATACALVV